jgi:hypothetical protein
METRMSEVPFDPMERRTHIAGETLLRHKPDPDELPRDPGAAFEWRVQKMMRSSARDRTWCFQRVREAFPAEYDAYQAAR